MIKIFSAKNEYRYEVIRLWTEAFGDSEEYICFFLDNCPEYDTVGYFSDGKLVSMFFMLNGSIGDFRCKYLYAACTDLNYRKQGIMEKLISYVRDYYSDIGFDAIFLVPANDKLYLYYQKFGFISAFRKSALSLDNLSGSSEESTETDIEKIVEVKMRLLNKTECFRFDRNTVEYTVREHLFNNGKIFLTASDNKETLAFYYTENNRMIIKEILSDDVEFLKIIKEQIVNNPIKNVYILCPIVYNKKDIVEEYTKCGMVLPLNNVFDKYINEHNSLYAGMYLD